MYKQRSLVIESVVGISSKSNQGQFVEISYGGDRQSQVERPYLLHRDLLISNVQTCGARLKLSSLVPVD
jgi:hypothetical protein